MSPCRRKCPEGLILVHADTPDQQPSLPQFAWPRDTLKISAATFGGDVSDLVPPNVAAALAERIGPPDQK